MTYPGTIEKTFLEICEEQAAQGNPAAAAFVAKKKHLIPPAVVTTDKITAAIEKEGFKFIGAIDPEIEAEMAATNDQQRDVTHSAIVEPESRISKMNIRPDFDKDNPDDCPF